MNINVCFSQEKKLENSTFKEKIEFINELTNANEFSEAMRRLKSFENSKEITATKENEVSYRLMMARVLRLSHEYDDAMHQLNLLSNLDEHVVLKMKLNFRKAALYMENPRYTMRERMDIVYPIIEEGILKSEELNRKEDLASFLNLKASMHTSECDSIQRNCKENRVMAEKLYKQAMTLFLEKQDTLNYHNVLNNLFRLSLKTKSLQLDSYSRIVLQFTEVSSYSPNVLASRNLLGTYYLEFKKDTLNHLKQKVLEREEGMNSIKKNTDNTIGKLKLLYEFDSLKADVKSNKKMIAQRDLVIEENNKRINGNILFSVTLGVLSIVLVFLLLKQKRLTKKMNFANLALNKSNHNYQLLIKESNHRIKNNLQMILSIIELDKEKSSYDSEKLLTNISSKILTIAALHRILNFEEHNQEVKLKLYFKEILQFYQVLSKNRLKFSTDFSNPRIKSERIVYFGLILNELISNTLKHSHSNDEVVIQVLKSENFYIFIYRDNTDFDMYKKNSGINLIEDLIIRFGGFDLKFDPKNGEYKFFFDE